MVCSLLAGWSRITRKNQSQGYWVNRVKTISSATNVLLPCPWMSEKKVRADEFKRTKQEKGKYIFWKLNNFHFQNMYFPANWICPHCGDKLNGLGKDHHLQNCQENPDNIVMVDIFYGDNSLYKKGVKVFTPGGVEIRALSGVLVPAGGFVKLHK